MLGFFWLFLTFVFCSCIMKGLPLNILSSINLQKFGNLGRIRYLEVVPKHMHEKINEPVEVLVKFNQTKVEPTFFKWRGKTYRVEKINMVHKERLGNDKIYYFSVSDNANFFRLAFSTADLSWKLEELYYDS